MMNFLNRRGLYFTTVFSLAFVIAFGTGIASAWIVSTPKWNTNTVYYRANQLPVDQQNRLSDARNQWNNVSPSPMTLYRNDNSYGIRVYDGWIDGQYGVAGLATRAYVGNTYISWATIKIDWSEDW